MAKIVGIEGIGESYAQKLIDAGIETTEALLEKCADPSGRKKLSEATEISPKLILKWANRADLARVKGIGSEYADLLEAAGVDTVPELGQRNAQNLHTKLVSVNEEKSLVRQVPSQSKVEDWVAQAKDMPRMLNY